jgi:hypothetical protein
MKTTEIVNSIDLKDNVVKNYVLKKDENYDVCVNKLVPSTSLLFDTMKHHITGKLSLVEIVSYLESFLVYTKDVHFMLYQKINIFITQRIESYKKKYVERGDSFRELVGYDEESMRLCETSLSLMNIFKFFLGTEQATSMRDVKEEYNLEDDENGESKINMLYSNSDIYRKIVLTDYARLFCSLISLGNLVLMIADPKINTEEEISFDEAVQDEAVEDAVMKLREKITSEYNRQLIAIPVIKRIENYELLKYNLNKYEMRVDDDELKSLLEKPLRVIEVRDLIMKKEDGVMKYFLIRQLVRNFGREPGEYDVDKNWYYCRLPDETQSVQLLPIFIVNMAVEYSRLTPLEFNVFLNSLIMKAKKSANNIYWVDENTGYPISRIGFVRERDLIFNEDEGVDDGEETQEKRKKHDDADLEILDFDIRTNEERKKNIIKIINGIAEKLQIGLFPVNLTNFILNQANRHVNSIESKESFEKKKRSGGDYEAFVQENILFSTVALFFVAFQTSLVDLKYGEKFHGCVRSYEGYPLSDDKNDLAGITYIACVLLTMKVNIEPWNNIGNSEDINKSKIFNIIKNSLMKQPDVISKIHKKKLQIADRDVRKLETRDESLRVDWKQFLPPLLEQKENLPGVFAEDIETKQEELKRLIREGSALSIQVLHTLQSVIFRLSLSIQKQIQDTVVLSGELLMKNFNGAFFCCQTLLNTNNSVFDWFNRESNDAIRLNNIVATKISNVISYVVHSTGGDILYSMFDTKDKFPAILEEFSPDTVYIAFIYYLKYNRKGETPEELRLICDNREIIQNVKLSVDELLVMLKEDETAKNCFTASNLDRLLKFVSKTKIVHVSMSLDCLERTKNLMENEIDESRFLLEYFTGKMPISDLKQELFERTNAFKQEIQKFTGTTEINLFQKKKNPLESPTSVENSLRVKVNFFTTMIHNMVNLYPEKILKMQKVPAEAITLPPFLVKLTDGHATKLREMMLEERNDVMLPEANAHVKEILLQLMASRKCLFVTQLMGCLPALEDDELTELLYEYFTNVVLFDYIVAFEDYFRNHGGAVVQKPESQQQIVELLRQYIKILSEYGKKKNAREKGIELSYQEISDMWFLEAEREKNTILRKLKMMTPDEKAARRDTSILNGKRETNKYADVLQASGIGGEEERDINEFDFAGGEEDGGLEEEERESGDEEEIDDKDEDDGNSQ